MNAPDPVLLPDVQSIADQRNIAIDRVGVRGIKHPLLIATPQGSQTTIANIDMAVYLPPDVKGTHMSRFLEVLIGHEEALTLPGLQTLCQTMLERLESAQGQIVMRFPYFIQKTAPISGVVSPMDYEVTLEANALATRVELWMTVQVPVTSLCPCSKKISAYGAHNQRSHITIRAQVSDAGDIESLIRIAETSASCELYGLLKRTDEKYVTERAYENPKFVEDLIRDVAIRLDAEASVLAYTIDCENFESIHNHSAVATLSRKKAQHP